MTQGARLLRGSGDDLHWGEELVAYAAYRFKAVALRTGLRELFTHAGDAHFEAGFAGLGTVHALQFEQLPAF